jgi:hypothetical protein
MFSPPIYGELPRKCPKKVFKVLSRLTPFANVDVPPFSLRIEGPTPNGGAYAIALFSDENKVPCPKESAVNVEIYEYDEEGGILLTTYGRYEPE